MRPAAVCGERHGWGVYGLFERGSSVQDYFLLNILEYYKHICNRPATGLQQCRHWHAVASVTFTMKSNISQCELLVLLISQGDDVMLHDPRKLGCAQGL